MTGKYSGMFVEFEKASGYFGLWCVRFTEKQSIYAFEFNMIYFSRLGNIFYFVICKFSQFYFRLASSVLLL